MHLQPNPPPREPPFQVIETRRRLWRQERAIAGVLDATRGIRRVLPVCFEDRIVGHAVGDGRYGYFRPRDDYSEAYRDGFHLAVTNYASIVAARREGRSFLAHWSKNNTSSSTQDNWYDLFCVNGVPLAGTYTGTAKTARQFDDTLTTSLWHGGDAQSGRTKYVFRDISMSDAQAPQAILYDRVIAYDACPFSAGVQQTMDNTLTAQRYNGSGKPGCEIVVTADSAMNSTPGTFTELTYTNQAGTTGQNTVPSHNSWIVSAGGTSGGGGARVVAPTVSGATVASCPFYPLLPGDSGARSIASYTPSAANTGTLCFVLAFPLSWGVGDSTSPPVTIEQVVQTLGLGIIQDGAHLTLLSRATSSVSSRLQAGSYELIQV